MHETIDIAKALSDANRVRALLLLTEGPLCVCQIIEMLGLAASTTSKHMSILRQAGLVEADKQGRWMHYRLAGKGAPSQVRQALRWAVSALEDDPQVRRDKTKLKKLLKVDKEALCRKQRN
ncbi:MAG: metalloregulator ArsR/SmtB family transcription factor [Planctomycetota bacterium]